MKHYIGRGLDVDFCKDYVRLLKERQAVLNVLGPFVEKTPTKVGDDMVIKNIRTNQRIFGFRKLNLDEIQIAMKLWKCFTTLEELLRKEHY